jgi:hypothetical protein
LLKSAVSFSMVSAFFFVGIFFTSFERLLIYLLLTAINVLLASTGN